MNRKFRCGFVWDWGFRLFHNWYDGPYWDLHVLHFWAVWNLDGLPRIFQDREDSDGAVLHGKEK